MRSIHLILTLGVTVVVGVPIKPRDFDFGDGGDVFGGLGNSLGGDFTSSIAEGGGLGLDQSFNVADNTFAGGDLGLSGIEAFDLQQPEIIATAPDPVVPDPNLYVDPQPQVVADVVPTNPGLGANNGDLIAVASTPPDTNQITPNGGISISFANNAPIPEFTPTDSGLIASIENLNPADIASSNSVAPVTPDPVPVAVAPVDPVPVTPPATPDDGLTIAGFVKSPVDLGADTALTPNVDLLNTPIAFTPDQSVGEVTASLPNLEVPPVQVASTDGSIGTGSGTPAISLQEFKNEANKYANDPTLKPEERQTWKDYGEVAKDLTEKDFGKLTLDTKFTTPVKEANGDVVPGDTVGDLTPKGQTAIRQANFPNAYRTNNGFNFGALATQGSAALLNALIRLGSVAGERSLLNPQNQIYTLVQRVGVPVSVAVPVTLKVGVAVPVTVATTLPGGVVTKILIYRPNPAKATASSLPPTSTGKAGVVLAKATVTPKPKVAKVKREADASSHVEAPKEVHSPEYNVSPPSENPDPEYYVEPEPKEWENTYGKEVFIHPVEVPPYEKEADKPHWDKIDTTFKYQPGDYSWQYPHPPPTKSDEASYRQDKSAAPIEEAAQAKGSGGGSVEEVKPSP